jgi:hypothetical protein
MGSLPRRFRATAPSPIKTQSRAKNSFFLSGFMRTKTQNHSTNKKSLLFVLYLLDARIPKSLHYFRTMWPQTNKRLTACWTAHKPGVSGPHKISLGVCSSPKLGPRFPISREALFVACGGVVCSAQLALCGKVPQGCITQALTTTFALGSGF